jgi:hypothetical protein
MKSSVSLAWVFALAMCGFAGAGVAYLDTAFTSSTRWLGVFLLTVFLLHRGALFLAFRLKYSPMLIVWLVWNFLTTLWSEQPLLSLVKSLAMALTTVTFISGGLYWARSKSASPLSYLAPFAALTFFAGLPGTNDFVRNSAGVELYQGHASNPNFLGEIAAISLTYVLFALYRAREPFAVSPRSAVRLAATVALFALLWLSGSRAAMLCAAPVATVFAMEVLPRRMALLCASCAVLAIATALILPAALTAPLSHPVANWVTKGRSDLLFSRERTWGQSYQKAREGGVTGLGFGVSAGAPSTFDLGQMTTGAYTREKANAQLAMVEETGLVGLALFGFFLLRVFSTLFAGIVGADGRGRAELLFAAALLMGLVIHSAFESWWTAPGSMEGIVFWATLGVASGLLQRLPTRDPDGLPRGNT